MFVVGNIFVNPDLRHVLLSSYFLESRFQTKPMFSGSHLKLRFSCKRCDREGTYHYEVDRGAYQSKEQVQKQFTDQDRKELLYREGIYQSKEHEQKHFE